MQVIPLDFTVRINTCLAFSEDGRLLAASGDPSRAIDTQGGKTYPVFHPTIVSVVRFVPGRRAAVFFTDHTREDRLGYFDLDTGKVKYAVVPGDPTDLAVAPDGKTAYLLSSPGGSSAEISVVRLPTLRVVSTVRATNFDHRLALSPDGRWLATDAFRYIHVRQLEGGRLTGQPPHTIDAQPGPIDFAFNHDGTQLAAATTRGVRVYETATGKEVFRSGVHRRSVHSVAFAPNRPLMATGDVSGKVFFWENGRVVQKFDWGLRCASGLAFAPDGLRCAVVEFSKIVVWDVDA